MDAPKLLSRPSKRMTRLLVLVFGGVLLLFLLTRTDVVPLRIWGDKSPILSAAGPPEEGSPPPTMAAAVDLGWYPPAQTVINNLTSVVSNSTTGVYGFIYDSSHTPDEDYGTYNWCNMPHVRASEYIVPPDEYKLVYVELVRHTS